METTIDDRRRNAAEGRAPLVEGDEVSRRERLRARREKDLAAISGSNLFDARWYFESYPDIAAGQLDPAEHYFDHGASEGRDPGPWFSTRRYLASRPDVAAAGMNPLLHFLRHGIVEATSFPEVDQLLEGLALGGISIGSTIERPALMPALMPASVQRRRHGPPAVFVTHDANIGGAPAVLASVANWFAQHTNYDVRIVSMAGGPWVERFQAIAPTHVVGITLEVPDSAVDSARDALRAFLEGREPAFVFINSVASGDYCRIDPFEAPRFAFVHELPKVLDMCPRQTARLRAGARHVFCDGAPVAAALEKHAGFPPEILSIRESFIEPGTPDFLDADAKAAVRDAMGWSAGTRIVMGCGIVHWRKQADVFVRAAAAIGSGARFVWIGDGEDIEKMRALARDLGVDQRVEFLGYRDDHRDLLRAADIFALPSIEDPFPLVCLDAGAASAPSVIFREAGGMVSFVEPDGEAPAGRAVPLGDEAAFFAAIRDLLVDEDARETAARAAHARVLERYNTDSACSDILRTIREVAGLAPAVSVVVPVYNSERWLPARLDSIAAQTFRDVEIVLRDDASGDGSRAILEKFVRRHPFARLEAAETNSGSVFRAWDSCIAAATGDLIWIAEADDTCAPDFLERMVAAFEPSGVRLAHGRSMPMDEDGHFIGDYRDDYLHSIAPGRWDADYCEPAPREINAALGRASAIPNASAVVVRRESARRAIRIAREFRLAGDWAFYVAAIHGGRIAYAKDAVNHHRRHAATVTSGLEGSDLYFQELVSVGALVRHLYGRHPARDAALRRMLEDEMRRFGRNGPPPVGQIPAAAADRCAPGVLFGVGDLAGGGAQMFAVRFVNGWSREGAPAVLFLAGHEPEQPALRAQLSPEVPVVDAAEIARVGLSRFMRDWGLDVVVTGHWWADRMVGAWLESEKACTGSEHKPWVTIMHGCYENVLDDVESFKDCKEVFARGERYCDLWVWTATKNRRLFEEGHVRPKSMTNIVNGFAPVMPEGLTRADLDIPEDAVVFTLASRAIEEKGWFVALEAFKRLQMQMEGHRQPRLLLIGDGPAAARIRAEGPCAGVHLVAHTRRLADYIALSDVGLLPSWFAGESLPLVLIEFLAQGRPMIVSDAGMCGWALGEGSAEGPAGVVLRRPLPPQSGRIAADALAAAMADFAVSRETAAAMAPAARAAFSKFDFASMLASYRSVFEGLVEGEHKADAV